MQASAYKTIIISVGIVLLIFLGIWWKSDFTLDFNTFFVVTPSPTPTPTPTQATPAPLPRPSPIPTPLPLVAIPTPLPRPSPTRTPLGVTPTPLPSPSPSSSPYIPPSGGGGGSSTTPTPTPDATSPSVSLTAPTNAATVSGAAVILSATASDNVAIAGVTFKVNGATVGSEVTSLPYSMTWDSTSVSSASRSIIAVARDTSNNLASSSAVTVTVDNAGPIISGITVGFLSSTSFTISWTTDESADSQVNYGPTSSYGSTTTLNSTPVASHSINLTSLSAGTTYHFRVRSSDAQGNLSVSSDQTTATFSTEAQQFFSRLASQPATDRKALYGALIDTLVLDGVWSKLDALYVFAASGSATALTNLKQAGYGATAASSPTFQANAGFTGNGSSAHVNTNFNPTTAAGNFTQDSASFFAWSMKANTDAGDSFGATTGSVNALTPNYTGGGLTAMVVNGGTAYVSALGTGARLYGASRISSSQIRAYSNGGLLATVSATSTTPTNANFTFLRGEGTAYYGGLVTAGGFGSSLTTGEHLTLYNALNTYLNSAMVALYAAEGDSITFGYQATNGGYAQLYIDSGASAYLIKNAVTGSTTATLTSRATVLDTLLATPPQKHILSVLVGVNDFVVEGKTTGQFLSDLSTYLDARRTAGWTVIVGTLLPSTDPGFNGTWRNTVNSTIRTWVGVHADALVDFAADPVMGVDAAASDGTLFADGEHPTDLGQMHLKDIIAPVINALL